MKLNLYAVCMALAILPACTWIEPTKEAQQITLVKPYNVKDCLKLGSTEVTVTYKVGIITRTEEAVAEDLIIAAKNRAAELGGDSIVAKGPAEEGKRSFDIYKCGE